MHQGVVTRNNKKKNIRMTQLIIKLFALTRSFIKKKYGLSDTLTYIWAGKSEINLCNKR